MMLPNDIVRLNARATTAIYNEPKIGILNRDDVSDRPWSQVFEKYLNTKLCLTRRRANNLHQTKIIQTHIFYS